MKHTYALILALLMSINLFSQMDLSLDTFEVTSLRIATPTNETGRSITVITKDDIQSMPVNSLDEILQWTAGLEVQSRGGFGVQADISMRGATFTQVLMLVDGMRINDPLTGHFNGNIPVAIEEIERIEIIRGANSSLYGPDAVGGIINIITKTFDDNKENYVGGTFAYGSHDYINGRVGFIASEGDLSFGGGISVRQSDGEQFPVYFEDSLLLEKYRTAFDIKTLGFSVGYDIDNKTKLKVRTAYDYRDFDARYFYTTSNFDKSHETVSGWFTRASLERITKSGAWDVNLALRRNTDVFVFSPDFPSTNSHVTYLGNMTFNYQTQLSENWVLKSGGQIDRRSIGSNDRGDHSDWHGGAYLLGFYQKNALSLSTSLRGDYDNNYGFELTPNISMAYALPKVTLRASAGRTIRAADYTERYVSNNLMNLTPGRSLGNPDLLSEESWSQEIGLDWLASDNIILKLTGFNRSSSNLIDYISTNQSSIGSVSEIGSLQEGENYFFAQNISEVDTRGIEVESVIRLINQDDTRLIWNLAYTYLNTSSSSDEISVYISSHANHQLGSGFSLSHKRMKFSWNARYKKRPERIAANINSNLATSYFVMDTRISLGLSNSVALEAQLNNILDEQYANILGARMPGRWLQAGVSWRM